MLDCAVSPQLEILPPGRLPDLPSSQIILYRARHAVAPPVEALAAMLRTAFQLPLGAQAA